MKFVRLGIIGLGNMGQSHLRRLLTGAVPRLRLTAVADAAPERLAEYSSVPGFADHRGLIDSRLVDAVLIATPHYHHTDAGIAALKAGLHVLVEKPISVHRADCERLIAAHRNRRQVFAAVFNQRTDPVYRKLHAMIRSGELGAIRRVHWTVSDWYRPAAYYANGGWRATWAGEGGGVLLNQCVHNLDLYQWMFGQPKRVHGFCRFGRYHDIEVEDDVTAYFEHVDGMNATFVTSTGEAPGSNRLEVAAERGRVVIENGTVSFTRNLVPMSEFSRTARDCFARPATKQKTITTKGTGGQHVEILRNFAAAILDRAPVIAPAREGIYSVELANAILLSTWTGAPVTLPLNSATYTRWLNKKIAASKRRKRATS
jgi:predicted dehydrogenase